MARSRLVAQPLQPHCYDQRVAAFVLLEIANRDRYGSFELASFAEGSSQHAYKLRLRKDKRGVNLISDALPFGRLWYSEPNALSNAVDYAKFRRRSHRAVIRVYDESRNVIDTHEQTLISCPGF
jgi:hypothetical protein